METTRQTRMERKKKFILWMMAALMACSLTLTTSCSDSDDNIVEPPEPTQKTYVTMLDALRDMSVVDSIAPDHDESLDKRFKEQYVVFFSQPIDHENPGKRFRQKVSILFRGFDRPTVFCTQGYMIKGVAGTDGHAIADSLNANMVYVEHRNYGQSMVPARQWQYETVQQEGADLHAVYKALKPILPGKWMSTGVSKNGETSVYYNYLYPDDMDMCAAFCAPFLTSLHDVRVGKYLFEEAGTAKEREVMMNGIRCYLEGGEEGLYKQFCDSIARAGGERPTFSDYVFYACEVYFKAFSYYINNKRLQMMPDTNDFNAMFSSWYDNYYDGGDSDYYAYGVDCMKWQGIFMYDYDVFSEYLNGTSFSPKQLILDLLNEEDQWMYDAYSNSIAMELLNEYLPNTTKPTLLVYSKDDPWTGARPEHINPASTKMFINPKGNHSDRMFNTYLYSPELTQEILTFVRQYIY